VSPISTPLLRPLPVDTDCAASWCPAVRRDASGCRGRERCGPSHCPSARPAPPGRQCCSAGCAPQASTADSTGRPPPGTRRHAVTHGDAPSWSGKSARSSEARTKCARFRQLAADTPSVGSRRAPPRPGDPQRDDLRPRAVSQARCSRCGHKGDPPTNSSFTALENRGSE
jgi:hypothetical protein